MKLRKYIAKSQANFSGLYGYHQKKWIHFMSGMKFKFLETLSLNTF